MPFDGRWQDRPVEAKTLLKFPRYPISSAQGSTILISPWGYSPPRWSVVAGDPMSASAVYPWRSCCDTSCSRAASVQDELPAPACHVPCHPDSAAMTWSSWHRRKTPSSPASSSPRGFPRLIVQAGVVCPQIVYTDVNGFICKRPLAVETPDVAASADDLGGLEEEGWRNGEAERLSSLEVNDEVERRRLLYWQVGGLGTLQDLVDIDGGAAADVGRVWPIGHEAAGLHKRPDVVHGRQAARGRECGEPAAVLEDHGVPQDEERTHVRTGHGREGAGKRLGTARLHGVQLDAQPLGRHVRRPHVDGVDWIGGIPEDGHAGDHGEDFLEELQLFPNEFGGHGGQSGDVATGPGEAGDEAAPHRIAHACHHDGDRRGRVLGG